MPTATDHQPNRPARRTARGLAALALVSSAGLVAVAGSDAVALDRAHASEKSHGGAQGGKDSSGSQAGSTSQDTPKTKGKKKDTTAGSKDKPSGKTKGGKGGKDGKGGDPAGNNGTVKIAPLGEIDDIPNNTPHPGCTFEIEWYGFDEGADIISHVTFAMQAPTKDVALTVDGPQDVFVGGDPATGAGTETGLDGRESYTLSFDGAPQAQQGYHVKLTVATPGSQGNDTKTKVFWVEPCTDEATASATPSPSDSPTDSPSASPSTAAEGADDGSPSAEPTVLASQATAAPGAAGASTGPSNGAGGAAVPTSVDAGEGGLERVADFVTSSAPLVAVAVGLGVLGAVLLRRRRA